MFKQGDRVKYIGGMSSHCANPHCKNNLCPWNYSIGDLFTVIEVRGEYIKLDAKAGRHSVFWSKRFRLVRPNRDINAWLNQSTDFEEPKRHMFLLK